MCLNQQWYRVAVEDFKFYQLIKLNSEDVCKVFDFFESKQHLGRQVVNLQENHTLVSDTDSTLTTLDLYALLSLPRLFPNLKILDYSGYVYGLQRNTIHAELYQRELKKWDQLEIINIKQKLFGCLLLGSTIFTKLTEISLGTSQFSECESGDNAIIKVFFK